MSRGLAWHDAVRVGPAYWFAGPASSLRPAPAPSGLCHGVSRDVECCGPLSFTFTMRPMQPPRRRFLRWLGSTSVAGATGVPLLATRAHASEVSPHPAPMADTFDMSWTERVTGRFRAVFDSPGVADGGALFRAVAWSDMYKEVYGTDRKDMSPVLVLRHSAIPLIMANAYWQSYEVGKELKMKDERGRKWAKANPISMGSAELPEGRAKYTLERFIAGGGIVLACNWAFGQIVQGVRTREKLEPAAARTRAQEMVIPGIILQPNGIFAALRAQEAGCHYVLAS
jgi:hypothetical protein